MAGRECVLTAGLMVLFVGLGFPGQAGAEERYVVKPGDSLYAISRARGVSMAALKRANHLKRDQIKPRQVLLIPAPGSPGAGRRDPAVPDGSGDHEGLISLSSDPLEDLSKRRMISAQEVIYSTPRPGHPADLPVTMIDPFPAPSLQGDDEARMVQGATPVGGEEEGGDGGALSGLPHREEDEAREAPAQAAGRWTSSGERGLLVRVAKTFLGVPYRLGGSTLRGLDCSALVRKIYGIFEISLPRTTREQFNAGKSVDKEELLEGDLVFFKTRRSHADHVGIYIGGGEFVHASSYQKQVKVDRLDAPYFSKRFLRGVRVKELKREI